MTDILVQPDEYGRYDAVLFGGDVVADDSLRAGVLASLFTERDNPDAIDGDRRGWWADVLNTDPTDRWGALLYTLARAKQTPQTLSQAKGYAEDALAWIVDDSVADSVTVTASWISIGGLGLDIQIVQPQGTQRIRLAYMWAANFADSLAIPIEVADQTARIAAEYEYIYHVSLAELA